MKVESPSTNSGAFTFNSLPSNIITPVDTEVNEDPTSNQALSINTAVQPQESFTSSPENASSSTFVHSQSNESFVDPSNNSEIVVVRGLSSTLWESEDTLAFSVTVNGHEVARREPDGFINCTKLLNLANITRGVRDGILKAEGPNRVVVIKGSRALRGIWINPIRSRALAERYSITSLLYPLFEPIETIIAQLVSPQHLVATQAVVTSGRILIEKRMEGSKGKSTPRVSDLKNLLDKIELALPKIESRPILPLPQDTTAPPSSSTSDWRDVLSNKINRKLEASSLSSTDSKYTFGSLDLTTSALPDIDFTTPRLAFDLTSFDSKSRRNTCPHIDYTPLTTPKLSPTSPLSPLPIDLPIVFPEGFDPSSIRRSLDSNSTATGGSLVGVESRSGKRRFSDVSAALTLTRLSHSDLTVAPKVEVESKIEEGKVKDKEDKCTKDITRKLKKAKTVKEENFRASKIASQSFESSFDPPVSTSIPLAFYSHPGTSYNGASPVDTTRPYPFPPLPPSLPQRYQSPVQSEQYFPPLPSVISSIMSTNLPPTLPYYNDSNTQAYRSNTLGYAPNHRQSNNSNLSPTNSLPPQHNPTQFHPHYLQTQPPPLPLWNYQATYTQTYSAQNPAPTSLPQTQSIVPVGNPYPPVAYRDGYSLPSSQYNYRSQPQYATYPPPTSVSNYPHPQVQARHSFPPRQSQPQPQSQSQPRPQSQNIPLPPMSPYPFPQYNSTIDERYQYQNQIRRNQEVVEQQQQQQGERVRNNPGSRGDSIGDVFGAQSKNEKRL